jgi:hypothetical protein
MVVAEGRYAVTRTESPSVLEDIVGDGCRNAENGRVRVTEAVIRVDICEPPSFVGKLLADSLSTELGLWVVEMPAIDFLLVLEGPVAESIQLLNSPQLAGSGLYEVKNFSRNIVLSKVERDECEVAAAQP